MIIEQTLYENERGCPKADTPFYLPMLIISKLSVWHGNCL